MELLALSGGLIMCVFDQAAFRNLGSRHCRAVMFLSAAWLENTRTETVHHDLRRFSLVTQNLTVWAIHRLS